MSRPSTRTSSRRVRSFSTREKYSGVMFRRYATRRLLTDSRTVAPDAGASFSR